MDVGTIAALWRYPVKSLRAEPLTRATVLTDGVAGDRTAALIVGDAEHPRSGKPFRGKESPRLHLTDRVDVAVADAADRGATVVLEREQGRYFDLRAISVVFDTWVGDVEALVGEPLDPLRLAPERLGDGAPRVRGPRRRPRRAHADGGQCRAARAAADPALRDDDLRHRDRRRAAGGAARGRPASRERAWDLLRGSRAG